MKARELVLAALLSAMALVIPLAFRGFLQIILPPFTATLGAHVPEMLAAFVSPATAVAVGLASALGFTLTLGPVVGARALSHAVFGGVAAWLIRRGVRAWAALFVALPVHALFEALIVVPFGFSLYKAGVVVGAGTALHHALDLAITVVLARLVTAVYPDADWLRR